MKSRVLKLLLFCVSVLLALGAMPSAAIAVITFDYDGGSHGNINCDCALKSAFDYDYPSAPLGSETRNPITRTSGSFGGLAEFLAAEGGIPNFIYRTGSQTENALTDAAGVSFRDSISSSANRAQVFGPGEKIWAVDTSKLPSGSVVLDGNPAGHVSVLATPSEIRAAIVPQSPANPLSDFGLKLLEDGTSYRIPKK